MLDIKKLSISYGKHKALDDISFHIDKGEVVGLGEVLIDGLNPNEKNFH